jgi:hypothetical protein
VGGGMIMEWSGPMVMPLSSLVRGRCVRILQAHTQVLCTTRAPKGVLVVTTAAGASTPVEYDSAVLLQPPVVDSLTPSRWSTTQHTEVTIVGLRWVLTWALLPLPFACRVGSYLAGVARGEPHAVARRSCAKSRFCHWAIDTLRFQSVHIGLNLCPVRPLPWFPRFGLPPAPDVNGVRQLPMRLTNIPSQPSLECGNSTVPVCVLPASDNGTTSAYSTTRIHCTVPPGVGSGFQMLIRGIWTALDSAGKPQTTGFTPPTVTVVSPRTLPISGGPIVINGTDFGPAPCQDPGRLSGVRVMVTLAPASPSVVALNPITGVWHRRSPWCQRRCRAW